MSLLPKGHEKLASGNYMKFEEGENRFRVLEDTIAGFAYWEDANGDIVPRGKRGGEGSKPQRIENFEDLTIEQRNAAKAFIAAVVWNYQAEKIQVLEITQKKIMMAVDELNSNKKWGDLTTYDIIVKKIKTGPEEQNVDYTTLPDPKEPVSDEIAEAYAQTNVNLRALFTGDDPFTTEKTEKPVKEEVEEEDFGKILDELEEEDEDIKKTKK